MANSLVQKKKPFSVAIQSDMYKNLINNTLGDSKRAMRFTAAITSAVAVNPALQECEASTILSGALLGESLGLSPSPQFGQFYLIPFNDNKNGRKAAQFQLGYKGYVQLAIRSGNYRTINVLAVKEGEFVNWNPLTEELKVNLIEDEETRENAPTIGYYACFEYLNGFRKAIYWSKKKMEAHAIKYSKGYKAKKGYTFWEKDFDSMALKTMLRQLISKWGDMSIERLQEAVSADMAVVDGDKKIYVDNDIEESAELTPEPETVSEKPSDEPTEEKNPFDD